jgi:hypothetical protein
VIFPFEDWCFQAPIDADVELWSHGLGGAELLERFDAGSLVQPWEASCTRRGGPAWSP